MATLTEAFVPAEFAQFVADEIERRTLLPAPSIVFVAEPTDHEICYSIWWQAWDVPAVELDDGEFARLDDGVLFVRRTNDPGTTYEAAIAAGAPTC